MEMLTKGEADKRKRLIKVEVDKKERLIYLLIVITGDGVFIPLTDYLLIDFTDID